MTNHWLNSQPLADVSENAVKDAIDAGYRHIDAAYVYKNEAEVGNAIRQKIADNVVTRSEMFITTKVRALHNQVEKNDRLIYFFSDSQLWNTFHEPERVEKACRLSLNSLKLDYIDLYLMHWPFSFPYVSDTELFPKDINGKDLVRCVYRLPDSGANKQMKPFFLLLLYSDVDFLDTWRAMEALVEKGLVRGIGVSNFNSEQLGRLLNASSIKPVMNQVEVSPTLNQRKLIKYCKDNGVEVTAYSPLGRPNFETKTPEYFFDDEVIAIGKKYGKSTAQVVLRYLVSCHCRCWTNENSCDDKLEFAKIHRSIWAPSRFRSRSPKNASRRTLIFLISN